MKEQQAEFKNPLPPGVHNALMAARDFLHRHKFPGGMRSTEDEREAGRVFDLVWRELNIEKYGTPEPPGLTVKPAPSFQPPDTCPDCAAGVPFDASGHHVKHREGQ